MTLWKDRRVLALAGMAVALLAGLIIAFVLVRRPNANSEAPPASQGGLVVQTGRDDDAKLDPMRPLRCFVNGQFVGELPLSDCAKRNGVATGALDVGLDPSGALAAANGPSSQITPLPPQAVAPADPTVASGRRDRGGLFDRPSVERLLALRQRRLDAAHRRLQRHRLRRHPLRRPVRAARAAPSTAAGETTPCASCRAGSRSPATTAISIP